MKTVWVQAHGGSNPSASAIKTHAKGAYKTPTRVSFSMQNRGKLPFSWQFTLFVVSSLIAVGICSSLALKNLKPLTIAQKGFLHDKERMISSVLINEKNDRPHSYERSRSFAYKVSLTVIPHSNSISISLLDSTVIFLTRLLNITRSNSSSIFPVCSSLVTSSIR